VAAVQDDGHVHAVGRHLPDQYGQLLVEQVGYIAVATVHTEQCL